MELEAAQKHLKKFIKAACNLYGVIHMRNLIDLLRHYEDMNVTRSALHGMVEGMYTNRTAVRYENGFFWSSYVFESLEEAVFLYQAQKSKPYYQPDKEEFMKYEDRYYYEQTPYIEALAAFLDEKLPAFSAIERGEQMKALMQNVVFMIQGEASMTEVMKMLIENHIKIKDEQELRKFGNLMVNVCNHTRLIINHGYTPDELYKLYRVSQRS